MPNGTRTLKRQSQPAPRPAKDDAIELVVRRGALRRYDALKRETAELPVVVSWDRRTIQRRGAKDTIAEDRRKADRRQQPPFTWDLADFVVVCQQPDSPAPAKPSAKAKASKRRAVAKA